MKFRAISERDALPYKTSKSARACALIATHMAAAELGVNPPHLRWFVPDDDLRYFLGQPLAGAAFEFDPMGSAHDLHGAHVSEYPGTIWVAAELAGIDAIETAAHEVHHHARGRSESDASAFGRDFVDRWGEAITGYVYPRYRAGYEHHHPEPEDTLRAWQLAHGRVSQETAPRAAARSFARQPAAAMPAIDAGVIATMKRGAEWLAGLGGWNAPIFGMMYARFAKGDPRGRR